MKRKLPAFLLSLLLVVCISACGADIKPASAPQHTEIRVTSRGTRINEDFDIRDVSMMETPDSTCFSEVGYDYGEETLVVTFRDSGSTYAYYDVPESVWDDLCSASSMGGFYNSDIKGQYHCEKIE